MSTYVSNRELNYRLLMPIKTYTSKEAFEQYKSNNYSNWPERGNSRDRFSPLAAPRFMAGTRLVKGEKIFTIGSCFARNIEKELIEHGFSIPVQDFSVDKMYWAGNPATLLNNYVIHAILPQIKWAFGISKFNIDKHCLERSGKYQDLQLAGNIKRLPKEVLISYREKINKIYQQLADARVIILTLGLVEAWWDSNNQLYINKAPPKWAIEKEPNRFILKVLSFQDIIQGLEELVELLYSISKVKPHIIITVSPVPLTSTFTNQDVAVANMYSKSVLRASVDHLQAKYDFISYYPSFESVMLTSKTKAFVSDQVHVSKELVRFNINRMLMEYLGVSMSENVLDKAQKAIKNKDNHLAISLLEKELSRNKSNGAVRGTLGKLLVWSGKLLEAKNIVMHESADNDPDALLVRSKILQKESQFSEALDYVNKALTLRATFIGAKYNKALCLAELNRLKEASDIARNILKNAQISEWKANAWMLFSIIEEKKSNYIKSISFMKLSLGFKDSKVLRSRLEYLKDLQKNSNN